MKHFTPLVMVVGGLAASAVVVAGAASADSWEPTPPTTPFPGAGSSPDTADVLVSRLQNNGYKVILQQGRRGSAGPMQGHFGDARPAVSSRP